MPVAQNVITAIIRLLGLGLGVYGLLGFLGVAFVGEMMAGQGMARMAAGAGLVTVTLGVVVFLLARPVARAVTFDMD